MNAPVRQNARRKSEKMKTKIIPFILCCISAAICFGGCTQYQELVGADKIEALREDAAAYDSARYFITNVETDTLEQAFTFMYDTDDSQIYLCEGIEGGEYYAEYSNGRELYREENGVGEVISSDDETFAIYSREIPHPYSTGQLFFYVNGYVSNAEETVDGDGNTLYIYTYDTDKINKALGYALTEFATSYAFDENGDFVYFRQHNSSDATDENGNAYSESYTYEITVEEANGISEIENPIVIGGSVFDEQGE